MNVAIIQARMGSTRLPKKAMKVIDGKTLLEIMIERISLAKSIDKIVVATTILPQDDVIASYCEEKKYLYSRGSEDDVLSRYYNVAKEYNADVIIRITSDCPLNDPQIIDKVVSIYEEKKVDYCANTVPYESSTYPDGMDVEVFSFKLLQEAHLNAILKSHREHVTHYFSENPDIFKCYQVHSGKDYSKYRLTVDYLEDFEVIEFLYFELKKRGIFGHLDEIIAILDENPNIKKLNYKYIK